MNLATYCAEVAFKEEPNIKAGLEGEDVILQYGYVTVLKEGYSKTAAINLMNDQDFLMDLVTTYRILQRGEDF